MANGIFVTGGTGFVGRRLLAALPALGRPVFALQRAEPAPGGGSERGITIVQGDLLDAPTYRDALQACDTVLHLAAATGKATADDHHRTNVEGTEVLLGECQRADVPNFVFVSSIAATFADTRGYPYALSKIRAEAAVRRSGLRFLILRPTMILGPGAPVLASLEKLARLPLAIVPGSGRARVQPIHVDDMVRCLVEAVRSGPWSNEVLDIGGLETISIGGLVRRIRQARRGTGGPVLRVPLAALLIPLRAADAIGLGRLLPIAPGQLSSFRFDGVGRANSLQSGAAAARLGIDAMIGGSPPRGGSGLDAECRVFTRHLVGMEPDAYVSAKYGALLAAASAFRPAGRFDEFLVRFARVHPICTKLADADAALFAPASLLRKKLVLLLAILETRPPFCEAIDAPLGGGSVGAVARIAVTTLTAALSLALGAAILLPARVVFGLLPKGSR